MSSRNRKQVNYKEPSSDSSDDDAPLVPKNPKRTAKKEVPKKSKRTAKKEEFVDESDSDSEDEPIAQYAKKKSTSKKKAATTKKKKKKTTKKKSKPRKKSSKKPAKDEKPKKKYEKPGQRKDTPPELHPVRLFYSSLFQEDQGSMMAIKYLLYHGVFSLEDAKEWDEKLDTTDRKHMIQTSNKSLSSPVKKKKATKRKREKNVKSEPKRKVRKVKVEKRKPKQEVDSESDSEDKPLSAINGKTKGRDIQPKKVKAEKVKDEPSDSSSDDVPLAMCIKK
mmetsp:Transcript_11689/g.28794  ORF Transcript_11689/g.28794 Transcript_11689/m.28794 type:complete len:278 (-) Transcript_11689:177-1010(-)|eukprot:CAMPEP_0114525488 /NCGR_PEP_ID=MMETSP0109-20121206/22457_1 /TAXON_ID=29199 /ORGANISM="Chlorarachnion reptans, Strain CCCM449" /LENGTH=277 /DNA_ID=CAMNT_0001707085 /DNA_START=168 /DNA_END=1001 /DNA_ORIENTATION=-